VLKYKLANFYGSQIKGTVVNTMHIDLYIHLISVSIDDFTNVESRVEKAKKFIRAIARPTRSDLAPIRVKEPVRFEQVETLFPRFVCTTE